ncbi:MAG: hypothetical protein M1820_004172 [Bogoriella megaspora]|nr:MAG: hypothetical protein M1820_004172 [Bogoriella megaspora]
MATVDSLQNALESAVSLAKNGELSETARVNLLEATTKLTIALQKPEDALIKLAYAPTQLTSIRVFMELGLFKVIVDNATVTSKHLAEKSGADEVLLQRLARVLVAAGLVDESDEYTYSPNAMTKSLATRLMEGTMVGHYDVGLKPQVVIPEFLKKTDYKNPEDQFNSPLDLAYGLENKGLFQYLAENPNAAKTMNTLWEANRGSRPCWVDWFPVKEKLLDVKPLNPEAPLLVDVSGGRGQDLIMFTKKFSADYPGKFVLHDLPEVCSDHTVPLDMTRVEKKPYNFFHDKVVAGARIYYMKHILHDWSFEHSLTILNNVTTQMTKGYSNLVIEDFVLPDKGCPLLPAMWDIIMMGYLAAMERTKSQWQELLDAAGLEIEGFYNPPGDGNAIIITKLKGT